MPAARFGGDVPVGDGEREGAGAEGDLGLAAVAAAMAEQRRLLIDDAGGDRRGWPAVPNAPTVGRISGSASMGTPNRRHSSGSHCPVSRFIRLVREAVVTSVA